MDPLISIIIPTYNRSFFLIKTIESILENTCRDYEIIIVDDGSTDNTEQVIKNLLNEKIKCFKITNSERGAARNFGAFKSKGKFLNFFDSDDLSYSNHIKVAKDVITNQKKIKAFHLSYEIIDQDKNLIKKVISEGETNIKILRGNIISCNSMFIERKVFLENLFLENRDLSGSEDWELWLRISKKYKIINSQNITTAMINHKERSMITQNIIRIRKRVNIFLKYIKEVNKIGLSNKEKKIVISQLLSYKSLHESIVKNEKNQSIKNLFLSFLLDPTSIITKRTFVIVKNLLIF